ncbi:MAG TPA: hypothetical protein PLR41_12785, partial [Alphaproteobacteria bacterium]|nr:hypothetical protein [Alphaproteobacteria bacterium]
MACLIVIEGPDARIVHEISHDVTLIGKNFGPAHREHLSLDKDTQVSGRNADGSRQGHAAVLRSGENYVL